MLISQIWHLPVFRELFTWHTFFLLSILNFLLMWIKKASQNYLISVWDHYRLPNSGKYNSNPIYSLYSFSPQNASCKILVQYHTLGRNMATVNTMISHYKDLHVSLFKPDPFPSRFPTPYFCPHSTASRVLFFFFF